MINRRIPILRNFNTSRSWRILSNTFNMSSRTITDIFLSSMFFTISSVKWSSAVSVEWNFLFPLCKGDSILLLSKNSKNTNCVCADLLQTFDIMGNSDMGCVSEGSSGSPDSRMEITSADFQVERCQEELFGWWNQLLTIKTNVLRKLERQSRICRFSLLSRGRGGESIGIQY